MDESSALPPEQAPPKPQRIRTSSLNPRYSYGKSSPATSGYTRAESPLIGDGGHRRTSTHPNIIAPIPRRHLLDTSASQLWLHTPPLSPVSSRASPPLSTVSTTSRRPLSHAGSFSTLYEQNPGALRRASFAKDRQSEKEHEEGSMGRRWIRWMHRWNVRQWILPCAIGAATLVKFAVGMGSYSGQGTPPMFGDYEAQRHWMELTVHLPTSQWYTYDLQYWGLDYPPLTAYVSWLCGIIAYYINPAWVALDTSRGIETPESKVFMRTSVVVLDALVYVPALIMFARVWQGSRSKRTQEFALLTLLLQPALLIIDFGHFQYNSVMLGFTLLAMNFFATGQDLVGAFFFVLSLGFKQMALYYAPAIGSYLLAKCLYLGPKEGARLFVRLAIVTVATFALLFLPFLSPGLIMHPITRIFPFARGLFEDKVANFWCASNVLFKWKAWASRSFLVKLSAGLTLLGFTPSVVVLLNLGWRMGAARRANKEAGKKEEREHTPFLSLLPYALLSSSMSFFLFSFQVHEKTILLPLMPITLLLSGAHVETAVYSWGALANNVAVFSMWPLLKRDGLGVQYIGLLLLWNRLIGYNPLKRAPKSFVELLSMGVYGAAVVLHVLEMMMTAPARYPDLFAVLNVLVCTPVFVLVWLWSIKRGIEIAWAVGGLGSQSRGGKGKEEKKEEKEREEGSGIGSGYRAASVGYGQLGKRRSVGRERRSSLSVSIDIDRSGT